MSVTSLPAESMPPSSVVLSSPPLVSIVIVNWNGGVLLGRCLDALSTVLNAAGTPWEAIVVDNGSVDGSMQGLDARPGVRPLLNGTNLGFGKACNVGARAARGQFLLFLNPDCELHAGSVERCLAEMRTPGVGACGVGLVDESGHVARSCHEFPALSTFVCRILGLRAWKGGPMSNWDHASDADVDHIIGAFYMMRRSTFEELGGFDERFFVYLEDLDLSLRIHRSGLRVRFLATPTSFHVGGGVSRQIKARRLFYSIRSRVLYAYKHFPAWQARLHLLLTLLVEPLTRLAHGVLKLSPSTCRESLAGARMLWADLPEILRQADREYVTERRPSRITER